MDKEQLQVFAKQMVQAVNWNVLDDDFTLMFWQQNFQQIWSEEEIDMTNDLNVWNDDIDPIFKLPYLRVLKGLTFLDTRQGSQGMPLISLHVPSEQRKAVLSLMGFMEHVHAKSYSRIFSAFTTQEEEKGLDEWARENPYLQRKGDIISEYYLKLFRPDVSDKDLYMAMTASVFLESFLFYSGFFMPLYFAGQGKLTAAGEIINLIIRDESIHGVYVGLLAQELYEKLSDKEQNEVDNETVALLNVLYNNELLYTQDIYASAGLEEEVQKFLRYNANKAMMNLGRQPYFPTEAINPIVENGLKTDTKNHDFFSVKGNGYVKQLNIEYLTDEDFDFSDVECGEEF